MADDSESGADRRRSPVENTQRQNTGGQSSAHASCRDSLGPGFIGLDSSPASMESRGHFRGSRLHLQFENVCDRSEDGLASMVARLALLFGQPAGLFCQSGDPAGGDDIWP